MACVRTTISIDADLFAEIERACHALRISRGDFFDQAARLFLEMKYLEMFRRFNHAAAVDTREKSEEPSSATVRRYYGQKVVDRW